MPFLISRFSLLFSFLLPLTSCTKLHSDYQPPKPILAEQWQAALPHQGQTQSLLQWWQRLGDPILNALLTQAEASHPSLQQATAAIDAARANRNQAQANALPDLTGNLKSSRSDSRQASLHQTSSSHSTGLDASWEIDLFGAIRHNQQAAQARLEAKTADWHDARVSLAAEVAQQYLSYRACRLLEASYQSNLQSLRKTQQSTLMAVDTGLLPPTEASLAQASVASASATLISQQAECDLTVKTLVALSGLQESELNKLLQQANTELPSPGLFDIQQLPLQLLSQRPDLVAAERILAAASAEIGVAQANRYPRLSLMGSISVGRTQNQGSSQPAHSWSFGPSLSLPLFDGGYLAAQLSLAQANYQSALAGYQLAVTHAVKEVEQNLVRLAAAQQRYRDLADSARHYRSYHQATEQLYQAGATNLLTLEQTRRNALQSEQNLIQIQLDQLLYGIALYKAFGGGWSLKSPSHPIGAAP